MKIYIARHGQNKDNEEGILNGHRDRVLTSVGINQAYELAHGCKEAGITFDAIYTSPLIRAVQTAKIVEAVLDLSYPVELPSLIERDFGIMTGQPVSSIQKLCGPDIIKAEIVTYFLSAPGAETFPMLLERARRVFAHIEAEKRGESILLVTHGDMGKMLYASYYNMDWATVLTKFHFGNSELLLLSADADPEAPHVLRIAQHNH